MDEGKREQIKEMLDSGRARLYPLTYPQRELWEAAALPVADPSNHIGATITVRGPATAGLLAAAMEQVVARQEVLRLSILHGKERPVQLVRTDVAPVVQFHEAGELLDRPEAIDERAGDLRRERFDLARGPLYRLDVLRCAADYHVMVLTIHHAIADGWSIGLFMQDLWSGYANAMAGKKIALGLPPLAYGKWGAHERAFWQDSELARRGEFWREQLAGTVRLWDEAAAIPSERVRWVTKVPAELTRAVRDLARRSGVTLFSALLGAFQVAIVRWSGVNDIVVNTPVAQRTRPDVRETIGSFSGMVPLRGVVEHGQKFGEQLKAVHNSTVECFANAMPFAELVRVVDDRASPHHHPVSQVRFALQNHPVPELSLPGLAVRLKLLSTGTARFDLGCEITEEGAGLEVVWLYRSDRFTAGDLSDLDGLFRTILTHVCVAPDSPA